MSLIKFMKLVYGILFIFSAIIIIVNMLLSALYEVVFLNIFPNDLGYSIVLLSIGIISLAYIRDNDVIRHASSLFISTILAGVMFFLRIMIVISNYIDTYIISLEGEAYTFNLASKLNYLEVYLAPLTFIFLYYAYLILRRKTI